MTAIAFGSFVVIALILGLTALVVGARQILVPDRPVLLTINGETRVESRTGKKLLAALAEQGIRIPSACAGAGTCGLCRVRIPEGGPEPLPIEAARMTRAELRDGMHLACQVVLRGDLSLAIDEEFLGAETYLVSVASVRQLTPLIREIVLEMPEGRALPVKAGSFLQVSAPPFKLNYGEITVPERFEKQWVPLRHLAVSSDESVTRAYSIANRPEDTADGRLVLNVRLALPPPSVPDAPPGIVSSWLFSLRKGDAVEVSGPFGTFRAQETESEIVFIGGGVGMAPLRALIHEELKVRRSVRKMSFWYGARSRADLYYADELDRLAEAYDNFSWTVAMSDPEPDEPWDGATGFVHTIAFERYLRDHPAPEDCEYYLCGPPLMMRAVIAMLDDLGVEPDHIFNDDFGV